jgi:glycosyltransferase involved in cell wall biosynthesis
LKKILVFVDWFEPAYKAGGPVTAAVNFVKSMSDVFELYVFTSDRDLGDNAPLAGIVTDEWLQKYSNVKVLYASPQALSTKSIRQVIAEVRPDFVYLHSLFSKHFAIVPMLLNRIGKVPAPVVLAPRGMLRKSALQHKRAKKLLFLSAFRLLKLQKKLLFQATDETEYRDVKKHFGQGTEVALVPDLPTAQDHSLQTLPKAPGELKLIFVGRIHPIKNLHFLLNCIRQCAANIELTIVGGIEDAAYWSRCSAVIAALPDNIKVNMMHAQPGSVVKELMLRHHVFALPTKGENFGHAIFEALAAGRPALISDQTPWRYLEQHKAGWDVALDQPAKFAAAIEQAAAMNNEELNQWCTGAWNYCKAYIENSGIKEQYIKLFS